MNPEALARERWRPAAKTVEKRNRLEEELLQVPVTWVRAETRAGRMPFVALGRYRRYDRERIMAWVEGLSAGGNGATTYRKHQPQATVR